MIKMTASTQFLNVLVSVRPGAAKDEYIVHTAPAIPCVTQPDTVINYQLYDTHGHDIVFKGLTVVPADNNQLGPASLSNSKKQLTLVDANTDNLILHVTLNFEGPNGVEFMHDPQIRNEPQP